MQIKKRLGKEQNRQRTVSENVVTTQRNGSDKKKKSWIGLSRLAKMQNKNLANGSKWSTARTVPRTLLSLLVPKQLPGKRNLADVLTS